MTGAGTGTGTGAGTGAGAADPRRGRGQIFPKRGALSLLISHIPFQHRVDTHTDYGYIHLVRP